MANTKKTTDQILTELAALVALLQKALGGGKGKSAPAEETTAALPSLKTIKAMSDDDEITALATSLGITFDEGDAEVAKARLLLAAKAVEGKLDPEELDEDTTTELGELAESVSLELNFEKSPAKALKALVAYFAPAEDAPAADDEADADADADEDEAPKKKAKKAADDDDGDDAEEPAEEEEDAEPKHAERWLAAYNKVNKKKQVEDWAGLKKLLTDDDGEVAAWGTPYIRKGDIWCCGMPLKDVEGEDSQGECAITGAIFEQDAKGNIKVVEKESDDDADADEDEAPKKKGKKPAADDDDDGEEPAPKKKAKKPAADEDDE